jgi:hypothetical protein
MTRGAVAQPVKATMSTVALSRNEEARSTEES